MSDVGSVGEWTQIASDKTDTCVPFFYMKEVKDKPKSEVENRAVYRMEEYVEIFVPGEKNLRPNRPVQDEDKKRWPDQYRRFKESKESELEGTPISQWPYLDRAGVAEMTANGFPTVELVAACPDGSLHLLGPAGNEVRKKARQFLQPQGETEKELRTELQETCIALKESQARVEQLESQVEALKAESSKTTRRKS